MKVYARTSLSEVLEDRIVYRNLEPCDPRIPGLSALRASAGLPHGKAPRKSEPEYAQVVASILVEAQRLRGSARPVRRLLFVGDTRLLDGTAFSNLCMAGGWNGFAFIGSENPRPQAVEILRVSAGASLYLANRWTALADFDQQAGVEGLPVDEETAVVLDIDKTFLGARGRNGHVIDQARMQAVEETVGSLLEPTFDTHAFRTVYDLINQPEFHPFTTDNQDYLAYLCLLLGSGVLTLDQVVCNIHQGHWNSFPQFMENIDSHEEELPAGLIPVHREIFSQVQAGDPTPFKAFRRNEYRLTVARFGYLPDCTPVQELLAQEIVITQEVRAAAQSWQERGALLFGLSDKPYEAALPTPDLSARGYLPIHRLVTHAIGENPETRN